MELKEVRVSSGIIYSHRNFSEHPYSRVLDSSLIRIKDLKSTVGASTVVFVRFTIKFDVFASNTTTSCESGDDRLDIGDEVAQSWIAYCNNNKPPLDVWIPHSGSSDKFLFWLSLSSELPANTEADVFCLEYSGKCDNKVLIHLVDRFCMCPFLTILAFSKRCHAKSTWSDHQHEALDLAQRVLLLSLRPENLIRPTVICMHNI